MSARTFHPGKLSLYIALSVADLLLTYRLLDQSGGRIYESNPIANAWLTAYGWSGLVVFKVLAMLLAGGSAAFVSLYHPQRGGYILKFACCALGCVVLYSISLTRTMAESYPQDEREALLDKEIAVYREYDLLQEELRTQLIAGHSTLPVAVTRLINCKKAQSPGYRSCLHKRYPGYSDNECLALELLQGVAAILRQEPSKKDRVMRRLLETCDSESLPVSPVVAAITLPSSK